MIQLDELKSLLWGAAVLLRGKINATGYKEYIFPLVFFKRISDVHLEEYRKALELSGGDEEFAADKENYTFVIPEGCLWNDIREVTENVGQALVTAWTRIEQANPSKVVGDRVVEGLQGIFGKRDHWTNKNLLPDRTLSELIEHFSKLDLSIASCPADEMGQAYEYLVGKFADDAGNTAQEFYTNRTVVELMAEILEPKSGESIYDPTCGTGGMLISCIARCKAKNENWREIKAYGQEQNALTSSVARMNLFLHGVEEFRIINDDTLLRPGFLNAGQLKTFDVVLANPPYSIKQWNRELFSNDPYGRNFLGTPPQGRADYAFIQHILKSMDPKTGRCAILLPHGVLFREEEREIRKALLDSDLLECVIGLAPNLFYNSPMEACVMICRAAKPAEQKGKVLFINAVNEVTRKNAESRLESTHIEKILSTYAARTSDGIFSAVATREEIAAKNDSLAISLYAHVAAANQKEATSLEDALIDFALSSEDAEDMMQAFGNAISGLPVCEIDRDRMKPEIGRFDYGKTQKVRFENIAFNSVEKKKPTPEDVSTYIGLEHLDPGTFIVSRWGGDVAPVGDKLVMKKGDVLFGKRRAYQRKVAVAPFDGIFSAHGMVLRPKTDVVDSRFFPFFIASDQFMNEAVRISVGGLSPTINWKTLKECEFDLPPIEKQRELAELLWAANDLKESYKKLIAATDEMLRAKFREMFGEGGGRGAERGVQLVSIGELADLVTKGTTPTSVGFQFEDEGVNFIKAENITDDGMFLVENMMHISKECHVKLCRSQLAAGDYLFSIAGVIGRTAIVNESILPCNTNQAISIIRIKESVKDLDRVFLGELLKSEYVLQQCTLKQKQTAQANISLEDVRNIQIPIPPLALQQEFVEIARKADETKANLKKAIVDLDNVIKCLING